MMFPTAGCWWRLPKWRCRAASAPISARPSLPDAIPFFFGEDQARYVIAAPFAEAEKIVAEARAAYIPVAELGKTGGDTITINDKDKVALAKLRDAHEGWFPRFMRREEIPLTN